MGQSSSSSLLSKKKNRDPNDSFNDDLGAVLFAVVAFLSIGFVLFTLCFCVTKTLQCYKSHQRRKKRRDMGDDDEDIEEISREPESPSSDSGRALIEDEDTKLVTLVQQRSAHWASRY